MNKINLFISFFIFYIFGFILDKENMIAKRYNNIHGHAHASKFKHLG